MFSTSGKEAPHGPVFAIQRGGQWLSRMARNGEGGRATRQELPPRCERAMTACLNVKARLRHVFALLFAFCFPPCHLPSPAGCTPCILFTQFSGSRIRLVWYSNYLYGMVIACMDTGYITDLRGCTLVSQCDLGYHRGYQTSSTGSHACGLYTVPGTNELRKRDRRCLVPSTQRSSRSVCV